MRIHFSHRSMGGTGASGLPPLDIRRIPDLFQRAFHNVVTGRSPVQVTRDWVRSLAPQGVLTTGTVRFGSLYDGIRHHVAARDSLFLELTLSRHAALFVEHFSALKSFFFLNISEREVRESDRRSLNGCSQKHSYPDGFALSAHLDFSGRAEPDLIVRIALPPSQLGPVFPMEWHMACESCVLEGLNREVPASSDIAAGLSLLSDRVRTPSLLYLLLLSNLKSSSADDEVEDQKKIQDALIRKMAGLKTPLSGDDCDRVDGILSALTSAIITTRSERHRLDTMGSFMDCFRWLTHLDCRSDDSVMRWRDERAGALSRQIESFLDADDSAVRYAANTGYLRGWAVPILESEAADDTAFHIRMALIHLAPSVMPYFDRDVMATLRGRPLAERLSALRDLDATPIVRQWLTDTDSPILTTPRGIEAASLFAQVFVLTRDMDQLTALLRVVTERNRPAVPAALRSVVWRALWRSDSILLLHDDEGHPFDLDFFLKDSLLNDDGLAPEILAGLTEPLSQMLGQSDEDFDADTPLFKGVSTLCLFALPALAGYLKARSGDLTALSPSQAKLLADARSAVRSFLRSVVAKAVSGKKPIVYLLGLIYVNDGDQILTNFMAADSTVKTMRVSQFLSGEELVKFRSFDTATDQAIRWSIQQAILHSALAGQVPGAMPQKLWHYGKVFSYITALTNAIPAMIARRARGVSEAVLVRMFDEPDNEMDTILFQIVDLVTQTDWNDPVPMDPEGEGYILEMMLSYRKINALLERLDQMADGMVNPG